VRAGFQDHCRGPFAWAYRAGCWFYMTSDEPGVRCGELVPNPAYRRGGEGPIYLRRGGLA
jgi:hypothetical protein